MGAFTDIWIGDKALPDVRNGNRAWQNITHSVRLSLGENAFYRSYSQDGYTMLLLGQLYDTITDSNLLSRSVAYIQQPSVGFTDPSGHYILFVHSAADNFTHVFTNRMGSYHAYWSVDRVISTRYLPMAKGIKDKKPDWYGISGFMAMGYFPGNKTYLEGISIFEPASYYRFDEKLGLSAKQRYSNWAYQPEDKPIQLYREQLQQVLDSSLSIATANKNVCLPLSGGLDSRMLAGLLTKQGAMSCKKIHALTYGYTAQSEEIKIGSRVAAASGIPVHAYVMPDYLFHQLDEIEEAVELFQYVDGTRQASAVQWLSHHADVVVGGHWGDVWMDSTDIADGELQDAYQKKIVKRGSEWLLKNICAPQVKDGMAWNEDYFSSFMKQYDYIDDAAFRMKIYKTDQWSFRWTAASLRMYQAGAFPILPFYDSRVADVFATIPQALLKGREFQVEFIKHYYPHLAKITWQEYDADLYNYKGFNNRHITYRIADKIKRTVSAQPVIQRNWEVFYLHPEGRQKLERILLNNTGLQYFVSNTAVKSLLDDFYKNPSAANGYTVSMLLTFTLFINRVLS